MSDRAPIKNNSFTTPRSVTKKRTNFWDENGYKITKNQPKTKSTKNCCKRTRKIPRAVPASTSPHVHWSRRWLKLCTPNRGNDLWSRLRDWRVLPSCEWLHLRELQTGSKAKTCALWPDLQWLGNRGQHRSLVRDELVLAWYRCGRVSRWS